jgi:hypothetical protein
MEINNLLTSECEFEADNPIAKDCLEALNACYPGFRWHIVIKGGYVQIKNYHISSNWCVGRKYSTLKGDAGYRRSEVVRAGGEFLERARLHRGRNQGFAVKSVDGISK